ncbi:MAG: type II secretion protein F [Cellulomonas sp.]|nr:type II secretion protein F [Cellulomonas sp.]
MSAQLRSGAGPAAAWARALGIAAGSTGVPTPEGLLAATAPSAASSRWQRPVRAVLGPLATPLAGRSVPLVAGNRERLAAHRERVAAVLAATTLADDLGAPLAAVLERLAGAVAADAEAEAEVRAAVAGPRATARVLTWLPLLGLVVGAALGADPVGAVARGGAGALAALLGVALLVAGRAWTGALLRRAAVAGRAT